MEIRLTIPDANTARSLSQFFRLIKGVEQVEVVPEPASSLSTEPQPAQPSFYDQFKGSMPDLGVASRTAETLPPLNPDPDSPSRKYWGAWKTNPLSREKIDYEIRKMRDEWDRDIY